jgi:hypothetical protein
MKTRIVLRSFLSLVAAGCALAAEGPVPTGIPNLDHVWVVMMENHGYGQVVNNPTCHTSTTLVVSRIRHQLLRHRPSEFDQLPRGSGRFELRHTDRQFSGLARLRLHHQPLVRHCPPTTPCPQYLPDLRHRDGCRDGCNRPPMRPPALPVSTTSTAFNPSRRPPIPLARPSPISSRKRDAHGKAIRKACRPWAPTP